jgi:adenine deaminase
MINSIEGNIVDIYNETIYPGKIIIKDGIIAEIIKRNKHYENYIIPGLVDSHVHIESSLLIPSRFAEIAITHGTIAAVSDPHEIANVCGLKGIDFMIENGNSVPFYFSFGAPSSVPSTNYESNGATIGPKQIQILFEKFKLNYLSEVMNYPGVINGDKEIIEKLNLARKLGKKIDGHAPELIGLNLIKYAGFGIETDHECSSINEAIEKIENGIKILIREGSAACNFDALAPLIDLYPKQVMLCTDDFHPDILIKYHINELIRRGLNKGLDLFNLLRAASLNPKNHYSLPFGLLRVNESADFVIIDNIADFNVLQTWIKGNPVFANGTVDFNFKKVKIINNFQARPIYYNQLAVQATGSRIRVINLMEDELITIQSFENAKIVNNEVVSDTISDILKLVVINRYQRNAKPAIGFVKNFGLKSGAMASSISHDSHNIIAVGTNDHDILSAINQLIISKGGLVVCKDNNCTILNLEIAGLMTQKPANEVAMRLSKLNDLIKDYGSKLKAPFMSLSFLSLIVIPHLKLSDKGLFNVDSFSFVELFAE